MSSGSFGALLEQHRMAAMLGQKRLGERAGIDQAHVFRLERGTVRPSRACVLRLASALRLGALDTDRLLISAGFCPFAVLKLSAERLDALLALLVDDEPGQQLRAQTG
jgi:transcriptional regulator with XRE-family HTH domain